MAKPASHFIAINAHRFHARADIVACCASVAVAAARLADQADQSVAVVCFDQPDPGGPPRAMAEALLSLGIELRGCIPSCNGQALNWQIEAALAEGHDFFYRVDADDLVFANRFVRQAGLFGDPTTDICGGGLIYHDVDSGRERVMVPKGQPRPADFLVNLAVLHPTMAFRLSRIAESGLRYWSGRVEDKALLLEALRLGLRIRNDGAVYGIYNCNRGARNTAEAARINAALNLGLIRQTGAWPLLPVAVLIGLANHLLPTGLLRGLRNAVLARRVSPSGGGGRPVETTR